MDWIYLLRAQQADFIERLKSGCLFHCTTEGQHSELTVISGDKKLNQLQSFCRSMEQKYQENDPKCLFINNMKGKLGEEVVKTRLGNLVSEVDYKIKIGGDGKIDFTLMADPSVGIQVKTRYSNISNINTVAWTIKQEEIRKNAVLVCILTQEKVIEDQTQYHLIQAGFLPTEMITNDQVLVKMDELLYCGGLQSYLNNISSTDKKGQKENKLHTYIFNILSKSFANFSTGIDHLKPGKYEKAIEKFNEVIRLTPGMISAYSMRAFSQQYRQNYVGAIEDYTQALQKIRFLEARYFYSRGVLFAHMNENEKALADFQKAADFFKEQGQQTEYKKIELLLTKLQQ
ncbi:hypothetical protein Cylst_2730 [Cylindrospermum stagnale PCC 7417]|uniref:Uncharacterized protein n=1 Tax=Cylindrospermum stagnale PCC 7417 TaxID=56107 RepID=K9WZI0_9NOST|nr:hypothetical protein [Cylindrospermum stagnale]AFZ24927.1 hypothetical protein Cylst_2730 [Cylindrospermum stagnale PCC 7417]